MRPLTRALQSEIFMPCDVAAPGQLEAVYRRIAQDWGRLDFVQRSIAYARKEDLSRRITDCSAEGFAIAMNVSVQSFLRMAKLSEPLMTAGGRSPAMSYCGAPERRLVTLDDAGAYAAFLVSDAAPGHYWKHCLRRCRLSRPGVEEGAIASRRRPAFSRDHRATK